MKRKRRKHQYSDDCVCQSCSRQFQRAVLAAIRRAERKNARRKALKSVKGAGYINLKAGIEKGFLQ